MVTIECRHCRKAVPVYPSKRGRRAFCNRTCYAAWMSANLTGEKALRFGKGHTPEMRKRLSVMAKARGLVGAASPFWKGGRHRSQGYVMVALTALSEDDRRLAESMANRSSNRCVPEHRLVMAQKLGRALTPAEIVHHLNGIKSDNRPENLAMRSTSDHTKDHVAILRDLREARAENDRLRYLLSMCLSVMSPTSGAPASR